MLRFVDSFDHYATADANLKGWSLEGTPTIGSGNGRNSTNALTAGNMDDGGSITVTTSGATCIVGFAYYATAQPSATLNALVQIKNAGSAATSVRVDISTGTLSVFRGTTQTGTLLGTSSAAVTLNAWQYLEFKILLDASAGTVDIYKDGVSILALTGKNTASVTTWDSVMLLGYGSSSNALTWRIDDLYIADTSGSYNTDFLGPIRVKAVFADGAGNYSQFTPSAGSNYQNVDETSQDGDTTYNSETTAGQIDTYTFAAVGLTGTVKAVQTNLLVRSDGAGSETIAPVWRISSTDYAGTTVGVSTWYTDSRQIYERSAVDGTTAWTVATIDAAEFGLKLVS